jgi:hypothetical protein
MDENQTLKQELQDAYLVIAYLQNEKIASDDCGCGGDCIVSVTRLIRVFVFFMGERFGAYTF